VISTDGKSSFIQQIAIKYGLKFKNDKITGTFNGISFTDKINEALKNRGFPENTKFTNADADDILFLTITENEFNTLITTYNSGFLPGFKRHLAVKFNSGHVPSPATDHGSFVIHQLKLRSWLLDASDSNIKIRENNVAPTTEIYSLLSSKRIFLAITPPKCVGKGHKIQIVPGIHTYIEPDIFNRNHTPISDFRNVAPNQVVNGTKLPTITSDDGSGNPIKKYKIISTIYLIRGINLSSGEFCRLKNYIEKNIRNVWDSQTNSGLAAYFVPSEESSSVDRFVRHCLFDSSGVSVKVATSKKLNKLENGEVLIYTEKLTGGRSFISGETNFRTGEFYYDTVDDFHTELDIYDSGGFGAANTAAHEFGHILGLADRYTYFAFVNKNDSDFPAVKRNLITAPMTISDRINGVKRNAGTTGLYIHITETGQIKDADYQARFNWLNNLMTTQSIVSEYDYSDYNNDTVSDREKNLVQPPIGLGVFSRLSLTRNYRTVNDTYYKYNAYFRPWIDPTPGPKKYSKVCVFITKAQADVIIQRGREEFENQVNFKDFEFSPSPPYPLGNNPNPIYTGTFIGPSQFEEIISGSSAVKKILKSDDGIEIYMPASNLISYSPKIHNMEGRLNVITTGSNTKLFKTFYAWFNPFRGTNALPESFIYPSTGPYSSDDYMYDVYYPNKPDPEDIVPDGGFSIYDIELGGLAYNTREGYDVMPITGDSNYPNLNNTVFVIPETIDDWINNQEALGVNAYRILLLCAFHLINPVGPLTNQERNLLRGVREILKQSKKFGPKADKYANKGISNEDSIDSRIIGAKIWNGRLWGNNGNNIDIIRNFYCPPSPPVNYTMPAGRYNPYGNYRIDFRGMNMPSRELVFQVFINRRVIMNLIRFGSISQTDIYR